MYFEKSTTHTRHDRVTCFFKTKNQSPTTIFDVFLDATIGNDYF